MQLVKSAPPQDDYDDEERRSEAAIVAALRGRRYHAFQSLPGRMKPQPRLLFVPKGGLWEWLGNGALWRIRAKPDGSEISLTYPTAAVVIEGDGLTAAAFAIDRHNCLFLQQHDPDRHDAPEAGEAVITGIRFFIRAEEFAEAGAPKVRH
jgi:hypothetical protein